MNQWKQSDVAVLMGGPSQEREVSLRTGAGCAAALRQVGYQVREIDLSDDAIRDLVLNRPQVVFVALHGTPGEDGTVQGLLELLGIPYTGSGVLASAVGMDKVRSKRMFEAVGVPTPRWTVASASMVSAPWLPCVVKPSLEGSSVGVSLVRSESEWLAAVTRCRTGRGQPLVEELIEGDELTVGLLDGELLGVVRIVANATFYDYEAKYQRNDTQYEVPARLDDALQADVVRVAQEAYRALGCRGVARVDVMLRGRAPYVLEVNTIPGMTATSLVPKMAAARGMAFPELCERILQAASTDARSEVR
jgi:D-alanine-D-alanine ligase